MVRSGVNTAASDALIVCGAVRGGKFYQHTRLELFLAGNVMPEVAELPAYCMEILAVLTPYGFLVQPRGCGHDFGE
jgi:hypothetical protein